MRYHYHVACGMIAAAAQLWLIISVCLLFLLLSCALRLIIVLLVLDNHYHRSAYQHQPSHIILVLASQLAKIERTADFMKIYRSYYYYNIFCRSLNPKRDHSYTLYRLFQFFFQPKFSTQDKQGGLQLLSSCTTALIDTKFSSKLILVAVCRGGVVQRCNCRAVVVPSCRASSYHHTAEFGAYYGTSQYLAYYGTSSQGDNIKCSASLRHCVHTREFITILLALPGRT